MEIPSGFEFCIDSPAITDGERLFFVLGFEYAQCTSFLMKRSTTAFPRPIHAPNEFRLRKLITTFGRSYKFTEIPDNHFVADESVLQSRPSQLPS